MKHSSYKNLFDIAKRVLGKKLLFYMYSLEFNKG